MKQYTNTSALCSIRSSIGRSVQMYTLPNPLSDHRNCDFFITYTAVSADLIVTLAGLGFFQLWNIQLYLVLSVFHWTHSWQALIHSLRWFILPHIWWNSSPCFQYQQHSSESRLSSWMLEQTTSVQTFFISWTTLISVSCFTIIFSWISNIVCGSRIVDWSRILSDLKLISWLLA